MTFDEFVLQATKGEHAPYHYQRDLAQDGLPDVLAVPTGAGKTLAATLPWLYRRRHHPEPAVRAATPRWLVLTLPMRVLVEQTHETISGWLDALGLTTEVGLHLVMGGESRKEAPWRYEPERDAIFVGTLDMLLSRALNRGYGETRWAWPVDFGLLNSGTQWVFDEVQLMGPGLPTSRQLDGLRRALGTFSRCPSMWMSATVDMDALVTVDNPTVNRVVELDEADRSGPLAPRLDAAKPVGELVLPGKSYIRELAAAVIDRHRESKRTIVVVNTVDRATELYDELKRRHPAAHTVLVHSRFRPADRQRAIDAALAEPDGNSPGTIVVSTQVLEAGVDVSATTFVTELAPWPSIVQRAGRCNRDGADDEASLGWVRPPKALPYDDEDLDRAARALAGLKGRSASPAVLEEVEVEPRNPHHPVLRRRDLVELFDTLPDLSGNDIDVARFIRTSDDIDVHLAWQELGDGPPSDHTPLPAREERCPVPIRALKDRRTGVESRRIWRYDHVTERWLRCTTRDLRPGQVLIVNAVDGGYDPERGWSPTSKTAVADLSAAGSPSDLTDGDTGVGRDPLSYTRRPWVSLSQHLGDVEQEAKQLVDVLPFELPAKLAEAAILAGRYHDLGKAHHVFQSTLAASATDDEQRAVRDGVPPPWAKSGGEGRSRHERPHFRHELASALALLSPESRELHGVAERDLVVYLVAAHHGRVRLGFRSLPDENPPDQPGKLFALGIWDGDELGPVATPSGVVPACRLDLSTMLLGRSDNGERSWAERAMTLRDREDLGPFRLGTLEALVRVADWKVSAGYDSAAGGEVASS